MWPLSKYYMMAGPKIGTTIFVRLTFIRQILTVPGYALAPRRVFATIRQMANVTPGLAGGVGQPRVEKISVDRFSPKRGSF